MLEHIHPGERIIPAPEPSQLSILTELLAEQRKTNELLQAQILHLQKWDEEGMPDWRVKTY